MVSNRPSPLEPLEGGNIELEKRVRPPTWRNPAPADRYNLVVVGGGTAGLVTAVGAAGLGARVALVERELLGGDCLNSGCVPSKSLIRSGRAAFDARSSPRFGVTINGSIAVDFPAVMSRMRTARASLARHDSAERLQKLGIDLFLGDARFIGHDQIGVDDARLLFKRACVATGTRPVVPSIPGLAESGFLTNETIFSLTSLPERLAILGGGPIGCELAQTFRRLGSTVYLIERGERILSKELGDVSSLLTRVFEGEGIHVLTRSELARVSTRGAEKLLVVETTTGDVELVVDALLVGVGRAPNVEGMGLTEAGVEFDAKEGIRVDDSLRTTNPQIYAAGDCASRFQFTHMADAAARIVVRNAFFPGHRKAPAGEIPSCTYTDPEIAHVGLDADAASQRGLAIDRYRVDLSENDRAVLEGDDIGFLEVITAKGSDEILGAVLVSRHAGETISELTLAMNHGIGLGSLGRTIHPYPTEAEVIKRASDAWSRTRLTPLRKKILSWWFGWRR